MRELERRNDIAHGDWNVSQVVNAEPRVNISELRRIKPAKFSDADEAKGVFAETLDQWSDEVHQLALMVAEFGQIALGIERSSRRVNDVLVIKKNRVIRRA